MPGLSRRSLLLGSLAAPLAAPSFSSQARQFDLPGQRALGVSPENDLRFIDPVSREPLPGPRWPLPGWWAVAISGDRRRVLLRYYASDPFLLATVATRGLKQGRVFREGVSSVKGAALAWPDAQRLVVANTEGRGQTSAVTRIQALDPIRGRVTAEKSLPETIAGSASGRRGIVLVLVDNRSGRCELAVVDPSGRARYLPLPDRVVASDAATGNVPFALVALSPDERSVLVASSRGILAVSLTSGATRRLGRPPGAPAYATATSLAWLNARHALIASERNPSKPDAISIIDTKSGKHLPAQNGSPGSIIVTAPGRAAIATPHGGISVIAANGTRLAHHPTRVPMSLLQPIGPYVMGQPQAELGTAGRRFVIDLRSGALMLDRTYDHAPSQLPIQGE